MMKRRISGKDATQVAEDMAKRGPIRRLARTEIQEVAGVPALSAASEQDRRAPPRVRKPLARNDQCFAPTSDFEGHRKRLRAVVALAGSTAAIENPIGAITICGKNNKPALGSEGDSLDDLER
jgi:hypothetical protein